MGAGLDLHSSYEFRIGARGASGRTKSLAERFEARVDRSNADGCWIWTGALNEQGYGVIGRAGRGTGLVKAHRVAWAIAYGDPAEHLVLHKCDNPRCVRVDHLFLGTHADNYRDMRSKARDVPPPPQIGTRNVNAKLTPDLVREIRRARSAGAKFDELAHRFGVDVSTIGSIVNRATWRHVA